jgi:hypothetical protein
MIALLFVEIIKIYEITMINDYLLFKSIKVYSLKSATRDLWILVQKSSTVLFKPGKMTGAS